MCMYINFFLLNCMYVKCFLKKLKKILLRMYDVYYVRGGCMSNIKKTEKGGYVCMCIYNI